MIYRSDILFVLSQVIDLELVMLSYQDSNLDKQAQNLLCYHYTIRQCLFETAKIQKKVIFKKFSKRNRLFCTIIIFFRQAKPVCRGKNQVVWHRQGVPVRCGHFR